MLKKVCKSVRSFLYKLSELCISKKDIIEIENEFMTQIDEKEQIKSSNFELEDRVNKMDEFMNDKDKFIEHILYDNNLRLNLMHSLLVAVDGHGISSEEVRINIEAIRYYVSEILPKKD